MMNKVLEIKNLKKYFFEKKVLENINLEINEGEIITILGKNGAGKTTMLNCILKLIPFNEGQIIFNNIDFKEYSNEKYFDKISAVLESSENVYYFMSGKENIEYFGGLYGLSPKETIKRVDTYIDMFDLRKDINEKVAYYSRGMIQKLSIIIAMISKPSLLLLDEPTLGLDIFSKRKMLDNLKYLCKNYKLTIILTTHQMDIIEYINERIVILENGILKFNGYIDDLKKLHLKNTYILKYQLNGKYFEEEILFHTFNEATEYLKNKKVEEIYEIKKNDRNLEQLMLEMEEKDV